MTAIGKLDEVDLEKFFSFFEDWACTPKLKQKKVNGVRPPMLDRHGEPIMQIDHSKPKEVPAETRNKLQTFLDREDVDGFVVFENWMMDSSELGRKTAVPFGPGCSMLKTAEESLGKHLGDVPSRFQYPSYVYRKPKKEN